MPARDGTGPAGQGPLTGRGLGPCGDEEWGAAPGAQRLGMGMAYRRGRGGWGGWNWPRWGRRLPPETSISELDALRGRQRWLKDQLETVTRSIEEREKPGL